VKRLDWLIAGILLVSPVGFYAPSVSAQEEVVFVNQQPPVAKVEVIPVSPGDEYFWIPGYWQWQQNTWVWVPGQWAVRPHSTAVWEPGYWAWRPTGWVWRPGRWVY
jgi:hypothetical protein